MPSPEQQAPPAEADLSVNVRLPCLLHTVERTINYICKRIEIETCGFQDLAPLAGPRREAGILCAQAYLLRKPPPDCVQKDAGLLSNFENYRRARHSIVPGASGGYCICAAMYESRTE